MKTASTINRVARDTPYPALALCFASLGFVSLWMVCRFWRKFYPWSDLVKQKTSAKLSN